MSGVCEDARAGLPARVDGPRSVVDGNLTDPADDVPDLTTDTSRLTPRGEASKDFARDDLPEPDDLGPWDWMTD